MFFKQLSVKQFDGTIHPWDFVKGKSLSDFLVNQRGNGWRGDAKNVYSNFILEIIE